MLQPRISAMEKPGAINFNIETLVRLAAAFKVGLIVKFVPTSEMLDWENGFSQDEFDVATFEQDIGLLPAGACVDAGHYYFHPPMPEWFSVEISEPIGALPEANRSLPMAPPPMDAGSTLTVLAYQS
jgi:hypothetical protein